MISAKKNIIIPLVLMLVILILCSAPMDKIEKQIKHKFKGLVVLKSQAQDLLHVRISVSQVQNILHVPFFGLLAFLWMKFFGARKIGFRNAAIYTLAIVLPFAIIEESIQFFIQICGSRCGRIFKADTFTIHLVPP